MSLRGHLEERFNREVHPALQNPRYGRTERGRNPKKESEKEKRKGRSLVRDPTIGLGIVTTGKINTIEIVTGHETRKGRGKEIMDATVIGSVTVKGAETVAVTMTVSVTEGPETRIERGTVIMRWRNLTMTVGALVIETMIMTIWNLNMTEIGMRRGSMAMGMVELRMKKAGMTRREMDTDVQVLRRKIMITTAMAGEDMRKKTAESMLIAISTTVIVISMTLWRTARMMRNLNLEASLEQFLELQRRSVSIYVSL